METVFYINPQTGFGNRYTLVICFRCENLKLFYCKRRRFGGKTNVLASEIRNQKSSLSQDKIQACGAVRRYTR
jgi:hypothetical protein